MSSGISPSSYNEFHTSLTSSALSATRCAARIPNERELNYHKSLDSNLSRNVDDTGERILKLTNKLLGFVDKRKGKERLREDDVVDGFGEFVVDVMDGLLEGTDTALDVVLGKVKEPAIYVNPMAHTTRAGPARKFPTTGTDIIVKPQLKFKPTTRTWKHEPVVNIPYPERMFTPTTPIQPKSLTDTPFTVVSTLSQYNSMLGKLKQAKEIAVDLEHHDYRSYTGILCLMQISTRYEDFVVDILDPSVRLEIGDGEGLRSIFEDPTIIKIFHGAEHDVVWLQRDFNIRIINLFDTFHASKILEFPSHSLSSLMQLYCSVTPDKQHQLADWRIRPLPQNLLNYARSDTHYLLYIYDELRNALLDRGRASSASNSREGSPASSAYSNKKEPTRFLRDALARSQMTATKEPFARLDDSGASLAKKWNKPLWALSSPNDDSNISLTHVVRMQKEVYVSVFKWRDGVAREHDDSVRYIMPNHHLFQLAEHPPATLSDLLRVFGGGGPPAGVKKRMDELLSVVKDAVVRGLDNPAPSVSVPASAPVLVPANVRVPKVSASSTTKGKEVDQAKLWGSTTTLASVSSSSALFGMKKSKLRIADLGTTQSTIDKAESSSLFGQGKGKKKANQENTQMTIDDIDDKPHFQQIVTKIHSSLVVLPSALPDPTQEPLPDHGPKDVDTGVPGMEVEMPYIPADRRTTTLPPPPENENGVVVGISVGRSNKRKRKAGSRKAGEGEAVAAFDFDSQPNLLDASASSTTLTEGGGGGAKKKQKREPREKTGKKDKEKGPGIRKVGAAMAEMKLGNVSKTFK